MPILVDRERANFRLQGEDWEPSGPAWDRRTPAQERDYRERLGELAVEGLRRQLRQGRDADGKRFKPVVMIGADGKPFRAKTRRQAKARGGVYAYRPDQADGPPLTPHYGESRFVRLLAFAVNRLGVTLFWRGGWGKIVGYHATRRGRRKLPVRDSLGLSPSVRRWVRSAALLYWDNKYVRGVPVAPRRATAAPRVAPTPLPTGNHLGVSLDRLTLQGVSRQAIEKADYVSPFHSSAGRPKYRARR